MIKIYELSNGKEVKVHLQKKCESNSFFGKWTAWHDVYRIIMDFGYGTFTSTFHNSPVNYHKPIKDVDIDCAVECMIDDFLAYKENPNINDFMHNFGYDFDDSEEYKRGVRAYNGCCSTYVRLGQLVKADELIELSNKIRGYE